MPVRHRSDSVTPRLINALQGLGLSVQRINPSGGRKNGLPDAIVGGFHETVLAEFKSPGQDLSDDQLLWQEQWRGSQPWILRNELDCKELFEYLKGR